MKTVVVSVDSKVAMWVVVTDASRAVLSGAKGVATMVASMAVV